MRSLNKVQAGLTKIRWLMYIWYTRGFGNWLDSAFRRLRVTTL